MPDSFHARSVAYDPPADAARRAAEQQYARIEDVFSSLEWLLARTPNVGTLLPPPAGSVYVYVRETDPLLPNIPTIWILYSYDQHYVFVHALKV